VLTPPNLGQLGVKVRLSRPFRANNKQLLTLVNINLNPLNATKICVLSVTIITEVRCVKANVTELLLKPLKGIKFKFIFMSNLFYCMFGSTRRLKIIHAFKKLLSNNSVLAKCTVLGTKHF